MTNLRPGPLGRLGLTYEAIAAVRPDVVMCQAHGWPSGSELGEQPAYDDIIQATSGIADSFTLQTGTPMLAPTLVADEVSGLTIAYAILAALFHRARTGEGQFVEVPMIDALTSFTLVEHGCAAIPQPQLGPAGYPRILAPNRRPFRTTDGWMSVLPYSATDYDHLFGLGGRDDLVRDWRTRTQELRLAHARSLYDDLAPIIETRSTGAWLEFCRAESIPAGPVRTLDELAAELPLERHPHVGTYRRVPSPTRFSRTPVTIRRHAPRLGEHGREVLREVGVADVDVERWSAPGGLRKA